MRKPRILLLFPYGRCDLVRLPDSVELVTLTEEGDLGWPGEVATRVDAEEFDDEAVRAVLQQHVRSNDVLLPLADEVVMHATSWPSGTGALIELGVFEPEERGCVARANGWRTAAALTHRVAQRRRLEHLGVNPKWGELECPVGVVLKSSFSTGSCGVALPRTPAATAIWERYLVGRHFEATCVVADGKAKVVPGSWLEQHWAADRGCIDSYELVRDRVRQLRLADWCLKVAAALDVTWGAVNVEFIERAEDAKLFVVEVNGRPGWEPADQLYGDLMDERPNQALVDWVAEHA